MKLVTLTVASLLSLPTLASTFQPAVARTSKAPMMRCANQYVSASLYSLANDKEAEMVIEGVNAEVVSADIVQPMATLEGDQVFVSQRSALIVSERGEKLYGVLNLEHNQPGQGQAVECQVFYDVLPVPVKASFQ